MKRKRIACPYSEIFQIEGSKSPFLRGKYRITTKQGPILFSNELGQCASLRRSIERIIAGNDPFEEARAAQDIVWSGKPRYKFHWGASLTWFLLALIPVGMVSIIPLATGIPLLHLLEVVTLIGAWYLVLTKCGGRFEIAENFLRRYNLRGQLTNELALTDIDSVDEIKGNTPSAHGFATIWAADRQIIVYDTLQDYADFLSALRALTQCQP